MPSAFKYSMKSFGNWIIRDLKVTSRNWPYQEENLHRTTSSRVTETGSSISSSTVWALLVRLVGMLNEYRNTCDRSWCNCDKFIGTFFLFVGLATLSPPQWLSQSPIMTVNDSFRNRWKVLICNYRLFELVAWKPCKFFLFKFSDKPNLKQL
jgi:hypothetical protein